MYHPFTFVRMDESHSKSVVSLPTKSKIVMFYDAIRIKSEYVRLRDQGRLLSV